MFSWALYQFLFEKKNSEQQIFAPFKSRTLILETVVIGFSGMFTCKAQHMIDDLFHGDNNKKLITVCFVRIGHL